MAIYIFLFFLKSRELGPLFSQKSFCVLKSLFSNLKNATIPPPKKHGSNARRFLILSQQIWLEKTDNVMKVKQELKQNLL
jgi:hypothetical protein